MMIRKLLLGTIAASLLAISPAYATRDCAAALDGSELELHGTIAQSI